MINMAIDKNNKTVLRYFKDIKPYVYSLVQYEKNNNIKNLLINYFSGRNSDLINHYIDANIYLPSFILLKDIKKHLLAKYNNDKELNNLLNNAIKKAKNFSINLCKIKRFAKYSKMQVFSKKFEKTVQPLGQKLINNLLSIRLRVKYLKANALYTKLKAQRREKLPESMTKLSFSYFSFIKYNLANFLTFNFNYIKQTYFVIILLCIITLWLVNDYYFHNLSTALSCFVNAFIAICTLLIAIALYPIGDFGKLDIDGNNSAAYNYKVFFNENSNMHMQKIAALKQGKTDNINNIGNF